MKKFAAVFPGQGSQFVGMFASFMEDPIVNATYDEAGEALGYDLRSLTFSRLFLLRPWQPSEH